MPMIIFDLDGVLTSAILYAKDGIPIFPCKPISDPDNPKGPYTTNGFKDASTDREQIRKWWRQWPNAIIGMPTGDNAVALDLDAKNQANLAADFRTAAREAGIDWLKKLPRQSTPKGGGYHLIFKPASEVRNLKLAKNKKGDTTIETRGTGGYIIIAPSPGYILENGNLSNIPTLSEAEQEDLFNLARSFNLHEVKEAHRAKETRPKLSGELTPGDDFDNRGDVIGLLKKHGWRSKSEIYWTRPGKEKGISATLGKTGERMFYVWSSNASPLESETRYSPWALYSILEHNGDFSEAARALRADGYGGERSEGSHSTTHGEDTSTDTETKEEANKDLESFHPIDLSSVISGDHVQPKPEVLRRDDDQCLFYRGVINGIHGDSGTGKGWVACYAIKQELEAKRPVMLIDMEDTAVSIVSRLLMLGVEEDDILKGLDYLQPKDRFGVAAVDSMVERIRKRNHSLVVIDSLGEAFGIQGIDENSDKDVGPWLRAVARRLAEACSDTEDEGPAVVLVDHSTKAADNPLYPSGSKRKRAAFGGASYLLTAPVAPAKGKDGRLRLTCAKDRNGNFARGEVVGDLVMKPGDGDSLRLTFYSPTPKPAGGENDDLIRNVIEVVRAERHPLSVSAIETLLRERGVKASNGGIRGAIDLAASREQLNETPGPRGARLFTYGKEVENDS